MESLLVGADFTEDLTLNNIAFAGDGGSLFLSLTDKNQAELRVIFYQTAIPRNFVNPEIPGFLLLNEVKVVVRSDEEKALLTALKTLHFGGEIPVENIPSLQNIISERISFFESEDYLQLLFKSSKY